MIGQTISHYKIFEKLGEGGMGVVYKAEDTKLERTVALKFLAGHLLNDDEAKQRFLREAKAAAALDHPNICHIYEIDDADGNTFISMAFLEGESLEERVAKGPLPLKDALEIGRQVAEGLSAAHAKGIVHRDIKPANILVSPEYRATIMDFGLARLTEASRLTKADTTMGTVAYMSPEQAQGMEVDHRSDIWALGCVVYEMVCGQRPFQGQYDQALAYEIVHQEPQPLTGLRTGVPIELELLTSKCLAKDAGDRYQSAKEVTVDLRILGEKLKSGRSTILKTYVGAQHSGSVGTGTVWAQSTKTLSPGSSAVAIRNRGLPWAVATVLALALATVSFLYFREEPPPEAAAVEFSVSLPEGVHPEMFNLSPDGRHVVIATLTEQSPGTLWVRSLDTLEARALAGTEEARYPFWSPGSRYIGFFAQGKLKKVALAGGPSQALCDALDGRGGTWGSEGVILFAPSPFGEIQRVAEGGGEPVAVTKGNEGEGARARRFPQLLPDSRHFLYTDGATDVEQMGIYLGSSDGEEPKRLLVDQSNAVYVAGPGGARAGYLLFVREGTLMAQPFDAGRLEFSGDVFPVAEPVAQAGNATFYGFSASATGALAYSGTDAFPNTQLTWFDRQGKVIEKVGDPGIMSSVSLSPDARWAAVDMASSPNLLDIWLIDLGRNTFSRLTSQPKEESGPVWSPTGDKVAFTWRRPGRRQVYAKDAGGVGEAEAAPGIPNVSNEFIADWSPDGRFMVVSSQGVNRHDLWVLPVSGEEQPFLFLATEFDETAAQFAPDGDWLAYQSNKSGRYEIYLRPFPKAEREWKISTGGGEMPRWRGDGRELYFLAPDGNLMAVGVRPGKTVEVDVPEPFFKTNTRGERSVSLVPPYDVTTDGQRFLVLMASEERSQRSLTVTTNWLAKAAK